MDKLVLFAITIPSTGDFEKLIAKKSSEKTVSHFQPISKETETGTHVSCGDSVAGKRGACLVRGTPSRWLNRRQFSKSSPPCEWETLRPPQIQKGSEVAYDL
jgi:hypothetical protein